MKLFLWKKHRSRPARSEPAPSPAKPQPRPRRTRKVPARKVVPLEIKRRALDALEAGLTAAEVGTLAGVSATAVERWRTLHQVGGEAALQGTARDPGARKICAALEERITQRRKERPAAGVRTIRDELRREEGLAVSAETVRRVVNDAGLGNPPEPSPRRPPQVRRFERELPNALWQIDIFTFKLKRMYPVYLVGMIDDHSRYLVGHGLYRQQTAEAVLEVVKGAIGQWGAPREILSDNGRQFAAWRGQTPFQKELQRQGVQHIRSAPHHPMTLGKIERFWKTIWGEFLAEAVFASFADACQRLDHWIGYYNHQRPHQGIEGQGPAERFYGVAGDVEEALKHGCRENALQLALGQEPQPPLYLLGKLGGTDVRIVRKGEAIEIKLGDEVREVIRLGPPFTVDEQGHDRREASDDAVEGAERRGAVPGGADGAEGGGADGGAMHDVWREPADARGSHGESGPGGDGGAGAQGPGEEGPLPGNGGLGPGEEDGDGDGEGAGALEDEVRDRHDLRGAAPEGAQRGAAAGGRGGWGKKEAAEGRDDCGGDWCGPERPGGGRQE